MTAKPPQLIQMPLTSSEMSSPQRPDLKGKESKHGEFKEQDRKGLSKEAEQVLGLLVKEKEEKEEKMKDTSLHAKDLRGIKMPVVKHGLRMTLGDFKEDSKKELIFMAQKKDQLKSDMKMMRSEIREIDKAILLLTAQEREVERLEKIKACKDHCLEDFFKLVKKPIVDVSLENASKSKQEMNDEIEKLTDETGALKSELANIEKVLNKHKRYRRILFTLSPPEWQDAQQAETLTKVLPKKADGLERFVDSSPDTVLPSTSESTLSSDHSDTVVKNSKLDGDSTIYEDKLELYFSDPQQLVDLLSELTDQNLSLFQNLNMVDKTMEKTIELTKKQIKEDEEMLIKRVEDMKDRVNLERKQLAMLRKNVLLHDSLKTEDQDIMSHALARKVTEVYSSCVNKQPTQLNTLGKLSTFEYRISLLQQEIGSIPEEMLNKLRSIKNSERQNRQREEKLKLEMEKQREKLKKYHQRSMGEAKKPCGRKLMPRSFPVKQKIEVVAEDPPSVADDVYAHSFTENSD